ncbi:hypothetical protein Q672_10755 [Marinobacter sp. EVN1]|uniref:type IV secretion system DNA-binding domain-containing protein n=1 Tax=Marinobacter sp. EVN1 TaxID=1397532 RepID=UPI0003B87984|nr:type IV secretion system DNA-binding domain-containing protein [Marinobacter sp. EVN1]ERS88328.1 hypothetical protein Q672_10755 [Marinobacter sp. EVN1]
MKALEIWKGYRRATTNVSLGGSSIALLISFFILFFVLSFTVLFYLQTSGPDFKNWGSYQLARVIDKGYLSVKKDQLAVYSESDQKGYFSVPEYTENSRLISSKNEVEKSAIWSVVFAVPFGAGLAYFTAVFLLAYQRKSSDSEYIRGGKFAEASALAEAIKRQEKASDLMLGTVPMIKDLENRHIGLLGDTGTGKSQVLFEIVDWAKNRRGAKGFIVDKTGEFVQHFYDPERDYILSPFDDRSEGWGLYNEGTDLYSFERLAKSFIPTISGDGGKNDHWPEASITVLSWLFQGLWEREEVTVDQLIDALSQATEKVETDLLGNEQIVKLRGVNELLGGTLADIVVDPSSPEHAGSVLASIIPKVRAFWYLRGLEQRRQFSIRKWASDDAEKGWVFIRVTDEQLDSVNPIITAWLDTLIKSVLSLPKSGTREIWGLVDELQSFDKINSLGKSVFEGRKHGLRMALGSASFSQLQEIYGEKSIKGILSMLGTKLIYRTSEPDAAEWSSRLLLEEDVVMEQQGMSFGTNDNLSASDQRKSQALVTPSEIMSLPDLSAFLRFGGDWPTSRVTFTYKEWPEISPYFIERTLPRVVRKKPDADRPEAIGSNEGTGEVPPPPSDDDFAQWSGEPLI